MASGKSIQKSVRLRPEVAQCIEEFQGEGFNEKLDNLVMGYLRDREKVIREAELLQAHIADQRDEMRRVQIRLGKMKNVERRLEPLEQAIIELLAVT